ncbi:hypothetical protein OG462_36025 [Streptomyces sp. NBC_01077]|nr:hypothetical protein OG462_36025 [Streptomyces sp. NBC_01077]
MRDAQPRTAEDPPEQGVLGLNLDSEQASNGLGRTSDESRYVREPWWRG